MKAFLDRHDLRRTWRTIAEPWLFAALLLLLTLGIARSQPQRSAGAAAQLPSPQAAVLRGPAA